MDEKSLIPINEKHIEKVTEGEVRVREKKHSAFADIFIAEDFNSVLSYVFKEVIVPSVKTAIADSCKTAIDRMLYGDGAAPSGSVGLNPANTSYSQYYISASRKQPAQTSQTKPQYGSYNDILFTSRGDAERVLFEMRDIIRRYRTASVLDYYDTSGVSGGRSTDRRYGWADLSTATVSRLRDGSYIINMPRALPLDD